MPCQHPTLNPHSHVLGCRVLTILALLCHGCATVSPPQAELNKAHKTSYTWSNTGESEAPSDESYTWDVDPLDELTRVLWRVAIEAAPVPLEQPFLVVHQLLACGEQCQTPSGQTVSEAWLDRKIEIEASGAFHPGQLIATALELGLHLDAEIRFSSGEKLTIGDLLASERERFGMPPRPSTVSEERRGTEYGWLLRSFCGYLGPEAEINDTWNVLDVLNALVENGIPDASEAQTHELEGMAICTELHLRSEVKSDEARATYEKVQTFLTRRLRQTMSSANEEGQVYSERDDFDSCEDEDGVCERLGDLNRQAHFLEWAILVAPYAADVSFARVVDRFAELCAGLITDIDRDFTGVNFGRHAMVISATSHARHAVRTLIRLAR